MAGDIRDEEWFFQEMPPLLATAILKTLGEGAFLLRSFKKRMALSFICDEEAKHLWIHQDSQGQCYLQNDSRFPTVQKLVQHHAATETFLGVQLKRYPCVDDIERFLFLPDIQISTEPTAANECPLTAWHYGRFNSKAIFAVTRRFTDPEVTYALRHQAQILMLLDHSNIVKMAGLHFNQSYNDFYIILEAVNAGNLRNFLQRQGEVLLKEWEILVSFGNQIANALSYLHRKGVVHNDLILQNCLVEKGDRFTIKLTSFLYARFEDSVADSRVLMQWRKYSRAHPPAPELLTGQQQLTTSACDIWSFGLLLWSMFSLGKTPDITAPVTLAHRYLPQEFCTMIEHMIRSCLYDLPQLRMSAYEVGKQLKSLMDFRSYLNNPQYASFLGLNSNGFSGSPLTPSIASSSGKASPSLNSIFHNRSSSEVNSSMDSVANSQQDKKKKKRLFKSKQWKSTQLPRSHTFADERQQQQQQQQQQTQPKHSKGLKTLRQFFSRSQDSNMNQTKSFENSSVRTSAIPQHQIPDFCGWNSGDCNDQNATIHRFQYPAYGKQPVMFNSSYSASQKLPLARSFTEHNVKCNNNLMTKLSQLNESTETLSVDGGNGNQSPCLSTTGREPLEQRYEKLLQYVKILRKRYQAEKQEKTVLQDELTSCQDICDKKIDELKENYEAKLEESEVKLIELESEKKKREREENLLGLKGDQTEHERLLEVCQQQTELETKYVDTQKSLQVAISEKNDNQKQYDTLLAEFSKIEAKMQSIIDAIKEKDAKNASLQLQIKRQAEELDNLHLINNNLKLDSYDPPHHERQARNASNGSDTAASNDSGIGMCGTQHSPPNPMSNQLGRTIAEQHRVNGRHSKLTNQMNSSAPLRPPRPRTRPDSTTPDEHVHSPLPQPHQPIRSSHPLRYHTNMINGAAAAANHPPTAGSTLI